jgi:oligopeptide/dipeptide ABC transporter ATP-binding protein
VGESGCGKTTTARLIVRMYEADSGEILYGHNDSRSDVRLMQGAELRQYRQKVKYVFQDPARSLNPRMSIYDVLVSGVRGKTANKKKLMEKAEKAIEEVGLSAADLDKRPAEFSGGQRQRISIARGLLPQPELLICDEVVSALDVSVQAQILNLLLDIRQKRIRENKTMSFLFIAHDLKVACYFCDRIGVMYAGELLEEAPAENIWRERSHPYTRMLFSSAAGIKGKTEDAKNIETQASTPKSVSPFCAFAARCPRAAERCYAEAPLMREIAPNHKLRCHFPG